MRSPNGASSSSLADSDTIAAIATPPGKGAVAILRVSGAAVPEIAKRLLKRTVPLRPRIATRVTIRDEGGEPLDEGIAIRFASPRSYTGEEMLELHLHGSPTIARETMRALIASGARLAEPGEFTRRAFYNGKLDLHAAAAVAALIEAETSAAARAALANLSGGLAKEIGSIREALAVVLQELAAAIDFPDDVETPNRARLLAALSPLLLRLRELRRDGERGRLIREGLAVAIVGAPNAGKSSLLNALLGTDRAIVSDLPGTTRDTIEERLVLDGVPIRLVDTAGIRKHADRIEAVGIERTERVLREARIVLVVVDGSQPLGRDAKALLERTAQRERIAFFNKADVGTSGVPAPPPAGAIVGSVSSPQTITQVQSAIARIGWGGERLDLARPHLAMLYEFEAADRAIEALERTLAIIGSHDPVDFAASELQRAFSALGQVSERVAAEEVLDGIFSRFCIGK